MRQESRLQHADGAFGARLKSRSKIFFGMAVTPARIANPVRPSVSESIALAEQEPQTLISILG
jgi:hypothetical protein